MKNTTTIATSTGVNGVTGALVAIFAYLMAAQGIALPPDIIAAMMVIIQPILHVLGTKYFPGIEAAAQTTVP